ncbi:MAG: DUF4838 domain-containing protein [Clostridia bacterium]|nr:DUF4838 domain-containing protein [Clostridia bacterium]
MKYVSMKSLSALVLTVLLLAASLLLLTGCDGGKTPEVPTDTSAETPGATDPDVQTDEPTVPATEEDTEPDTEPATEPDTAPVIVPTIFDYEGPGVKSLTIAGVPVDQFTVIYPAAADGMPLERDSEDFDATIVADRTAAVDLAYYLSMATGKKIEAKPDSETYGHEIAVGHTARDTDTVRSMREGLLSEGYLLLCENGRLYISGDSNQGTPNGVYSFLDEYIGVRFFTQTLEKVLPAEEIAIPADLNVRYMPAFLYRNTSWTCINLNDADATDTLNANAFGAKSKINARNDDRNLLIYGGGIKPLLADHNLGSLSETGDGLSKQPCLTDEEVLKKVYKAVKKKLKSNPDARYVVVSQNDSESFCTCENCRALYKAEGYSGAVISFLNKLSDMLAEDYPDIYIRTLAYQNTLTPPKTIKPNKNIIVMLAPIDSCYSHVIGDETCSRSKEYGEILEGWAAITERLCVWDYTTNYQYYLSPYPDFKIMREDLAIYAAHRVEGMYAQGNSQGQSGEFGALRTYLLAKLMWEPTMSEERYYAYMDEFLQAYYGEGWQYIRTYIDKMCERSAMSHLEANCDLRAAWAPDRLEDGSVDMTFLREMEALWAEAAAHSSEGYQDHIEQSSIQVLFSDIWLSTQKNTDKDKNSRLISLCKKYKITWFNGGLEMNASNLRSRVPRDYNF